MNAKHRSLKGLAALAAALCAGCSSSAAREQYQPRAQSIVLPAGEQSFVLFGDGAIAKQGPSGEEWREEARAREPSAAGYDLGSGWACVGYEDSLALVRLGGKRVEWVPSPIPGLYRSIGVHGDVAALNAGDRVQLTTIPGGEQHVAPLDATGWLSQFGLDKVDYALPTSPCSVLLIASRDKGMFTEGAVSVIRANGCRGTWEQEGDQLLRGLTWVDRCDSDGRSLYVAGIHEEGQLGSLRRPGRLVQRLVVMKVDLADLIPSEFVRLERVERSTVVRDLAVGTEAVAILLDSGELWILSLAGARLYEKVHPQAESVAWVGSGELVVLAGGKTQRVRYDN